VKRIFSAKILFVGLSFLFLVTGRVEGAEANSVHVVTYEGVINPVTAEFITYAIDRAEENGAHAVVIQLDTPGGLDTSMRDIIKTMNSASMPIIVYVAPKGARAASAGVFITMAANVAAMAPGTNIGAAHPVAMGGGKIEGDMKKKVENDAAAYIKSIAERRGRNVQWAEDAVRESVSATEKEAVKKNVVDFVANDLASLLKQADGRETETSAGKVVLKTAGAATESVEMGLRFRILKAISDPNIAYILMMIGIYGLIFELSTPGAILPGVIGGICLILAFYAFQTLPVNYAGFALILLAVILFIAEVKVPSYGMLTVGGIIAMTLGSLMLIKGDAEYMKISMGVIAPFVLTSALFFVLIVGTAFKALGRQAVTGREGLVGAVGVAKTDLTPAGQILVHGEIWSAESRSPISAGDPVVVKRMLGLKLFVDKKDSNDDSS
jgi:membrane-bound serine protease (ClpP class)